MNNITIPSWPNSWSYAWFYEHMHSYLTIDLELFGKYLSALFSKFLKEQYYFQKFTPIVKTDDERPIFWQGEDRKNLAIISPILYDENIEHNYNNVRVVHANDLRPNYLQANTLYSKEYASLFSKAPLKLDEKEFLLYFGDYACEKTEISLGYMENLQFIPTDSFKLQPTTEVNHSNLFYPFVEDFIKAIFKYKILNKKPIINESDMEVILEEFGISRKEKLQTLLGVLKAMQEESTEELLANNKVGSVLNLKRSNNNSRI